MMTDFHAHRRHLDPPGGDPPTPKGWNPDGTHTGNPARLDPRIDPFDAHPSRNPYPARMPSLGMDARMDRHVQLVHHYSKRAYEEGILIEGGERALPPELQRGDRYRRAELAQMILRRKAVLEEMGTGVVLLSPQEQAALDAAAGGEEAAA